MRYRSVVPWRNPEQFYKVFRCLYSTTITDKRWAVDQISVWETRCHPALPAAIDATANLVRAVIQDLLYEVEKSLCQAKDIQMFYAMALVRFVNLTLEVDQNSKSKIWMSTLADKRNIPRWIIELRHDSVHAFCPSLPVLRMGAQTALTYLENNFWKLEAANIQSIVKVPSNEKKEIFDLITRYRNIQHCRREKKGTKEELKRDLKAVVQKLTRYIVVSKEKVVDAVLQPGAFICREDLIKMLQASVSVYLELEDDLSLPPELERFWLPIIRIFHQYDLIPLFIEKLLLSQEQCTNHICQKIAAAWAMRLFLATSSHASNTALDRCFKEKGVLFDLHRLLYACMKGANRYSIQLFHMIVNRLGNKERYSQLFCIIALYQGWFVESDQRMSARPPMKRPRDTTLSEIVFNLDDVEDDLNELKMRRKRPRRDNIWSLAPVRLNMAEIPLGAVLHPVVEEGSTKEESLTETPAETTPQEEQFIYLNENDNEEITVEEKDTPDDWLETFRPEQFDMVYRRRQKN